MTWTNKTQDEIRDEIIKIAKEETGLSSFKEAGVLRGLIETYTKATYALYRDSINFYGGQFTYQKASGTMLDLRGRELGVTRLEARKVLGKFEFDATKSGEIAKGTWIVTSGGVRFRVTAALAFTARHNNTVEVEGELPGAKYNILANTSIRTTSVIDGVVRWIVPANWTTKAGRDEESDKDYRVRIAAKWDGQGPDNRPGKYKQIALKTPGVNDVRVVRTPRGSGSVDVILGGDAGIPPQSVCDAVLKAFSGAYLLTRDILVKPATAVSREFELTYSGTATATQVEAALRVWLHRRKIGEDLTMQALYKSPLAPLEVNTIEYQRPRQDVEVGPSSKIVAKSIKVTHRKAA